MHYHQAPAMGREVGKASVWGWAWRRNLKLCKAEECVYVFGGGEGIVHTGHEQQLPCVDEGCKLWSRVWTWFLGGG